MTMTLLLIVSAWMLVLWLATGLCAAARLGDLAQPEELGIGRDGAPLSGDSLAA